MTRYLRNSISVLLLAMLFTYCNGQVKTNLPKNTLVTEVQAKFPKPRGTFKDASVGCALQDKAGNIWLGTNGEGLFRYNGKTFINFTTKDGLDNEIIYSLLEDKKGNIWIGTKTGLCRFDGKSFTKIPIVINFGSDFYSTTSVHGTASPVNGVWTMMQDKKGTIWFGTDDGIYCYDGANFTCFLDNSAIINADHLHLKAIFSIVEDKNSNIWFGSCIGEGFICFDGKTLSQISPKGYARTQSIVEDKNGTIWFGSIGKGICQYDPSAAHSADGKTIITNFFKEKDVSGFLYFIFKDHAGNLWFCAPYGNRALSYYNGNETISFADRADFTNKKMYPVLEDKDGNIWFASSGMALYRFDGKTIENFSE